MKVINCLAHFDHTKALKTLAHPTFIDIDSIIAIRNVDYDSKCIHIILPNNGFYIFGDKAIDYIKSHFTANCVDLTN